MNLPGKEGRPSVMVTGAQQTDRKKENASVSTLGQKLVDGKEAVWSLDAAWVAEMLEEQGRSRTPVRKGLQSR